MELAIGKADFARALSSVSKAIEARNTIPVLSCVRLATDGATLRVTGTDLDIEVTDTAPADVIASGAVCVDAKLLSSIVAKAAGDINLKLADGKLTVKSGRSKFTLAVLPAGDFPDLPGAVYDAEFELDIAAFFGPCVHAISSEEVRFYLNGVFFYSDGATAVAVATDGHRLVKNTLDHAAEFAGVIVPRKLVGLLPKGACKVSVSQSRIRLQQGDLVIVSKLVDGTFPDFQRVIPSGNDKHITFASDDMKAAVGRVTVISSERGRAVKIAFAGGGATLTVSNPESGTATDEIAVTYDGEPVDIGFNGSYLGELMGIFPAGDISVALSDGGSPALFTSDKAPGLLGVCMPMRV